MIVSASPTSYQEAIEKESFFPITRELKYGQFSETRKDKNAPSITEATDHVEGYIRMSAQEHFYLETNVSLIVPSKEDGEMECFISTQHPSECQHLISHVLGIQSNKVQVRVWPLSIFSDDEYRSKD